jgi:hypothetical protein
MAQVERLVDKTPVFAFAVGVLERHLVYWSATMARNGCPSK